MTVVLDFAWSKLSLAAGLALVVLRLPLTFVEVRPGFGTPCKADTTDPVFPTKMTVPPLLCAAAFLVAVGAAVSATGAP